MGRGRQPADRRGGDGGAGPARRDAAALGLESLLEADEEAPEELQRLADEREEARAARDFDRADQIRDRLAGEGWEIRDTPAGARLVRRP